MLYTLTSVWVLHPPNAGRKLFFSVFMQNFDANEENAAKADNFGLFPINGRQKNAGLVF